MSMRMLIDARHGEETRVTVVRNNRVEEFDYESAAKRQLKGNIYLAKVTRVEPSLQACFVDYGGNRHGFLAFSEIHPDYYQIPHEDREALLKAEAEEAKKQADQTTAQDDREAKSGVPAEGVPAEGEVEEVAGDVDIEDVRARRATELRRRYKIQEVIKRRQIMLVQVVKEERGTKGAALTTHLSLAGRYCVLMPNSPHAGGISRKIGNAADRKKLKSVMSALQVPEGMGCIIRTAGLNRTKAEIKRDFDYLLRLWDGIRDLTLKSIAPALIYEEANIIKRSIRDLYTRDLEEVLVEGEEGYRVAKDFMKLLIPSHAKRVKHYRDPVPLFHRYQVESQLESMYSPVVQLKSGGYIVINPTEALVSIDVNSGRSTKEHNVEETAIKTNLEAADEIARQLRLRDMAGLVVIDFIDMHERSNNRSVEKRLKEALKGDRARIQVGGISMFGLIEMSRQRLRPNLLEASMEICPTCTGSGVVRSTESAALAILRALEEEGIKGRNAAVTVEAPTAVAIYLLNEKRRMLSELEAQYDFAIQVNARDDFSSQSYELERTPKSAQTDTPAERDVVSPEAIAVSSDGEERKPAAADSEADAAPASKRGESESDDVDSGQQARRSRRRGRGRRGRGRKTQSQQAEEATASSEDASQAETARDRAQMTEADQPAAETKADSKEDSDTAKAKQPAKAKAKSKTASTAKTGDGRRKRSRKKAEAPMAEQPDDTTQTAGSEQTADTAQTADTEAPAKKTTATKRKSAGRSRKTAKTNAESSSADDQPAPEQAPQAEEGATDTSGASPAGSETAPASSTTRRRRRRTPSGRSSKRSQAAPTASQPAAEQPPENAAEASAQQAPAETPSMAEKPAQPAAAAASDTAQSPSVERTVVAPEGADAQEAEKSNGRSKRKRGWWRRAIGK